KGFTINLPPLRVRGDDIPMLVRHYISRFRRELNKAVSDVSPEALELLKEYAWPGNIRQMQSVLRQAILQATGPLLLPDFLPAEIRQPTASTPSVNGAADRPAGES